jgi:hypothetical protein
MTGPVAKVKGKYRYIYIYILLSDSEREGLSGLSEPPGLFAGELDSFGGSCNE